jgi:hypothetical protein
MNGYTDYIFQRDLLRQRKSDSYVKSFLKE